MTQAFEELGLSPELAAAVDAAGFEDPTPLQRTAIPVIRRGSNVALRGSSGAGVTAAYGLGVLDLLALGARPWGSEAPRALVVAVSPERASEVATALAGFARGLDLRVRAMGPGWRRGPSDVVVAPVDAALRGVQDSSLKLDELQVFVLDGASAVLALHGSEAVEALVVTVNPQAQRIVTTSEMTKGVEAFIQGHARRAMEIPPPRADRGAVPTPPSRGALFYVVVAPGEKENALAELVSRRTDMPHTVIARTGARAGRLREALTLRGFAVAAERESGTTDSITVAGALDAAGATIAYDVPADARVLERMHADGVVLVVARELPHLRAVADAAGFTLRTLERRTRRGTIATFRERVRRAVAQEDLDPQLLVLEPLFEEFSATEVAAALSAMIRAREPPSATLTPTAAPAEPARPTAFVRLFVGIGQRDGLRPADIVGAFTSEAGVTGEQVGRIEIRDTFSLVEVEATAAERVIRALNGTTMRGRSLRVDFDRKTPPPSSPSRRSRPNRAPP